MKKDSLGEGSTQKKTQARLDYFLISEETFEIANDCNTLSGYRTDILQLHYNLS